ncbi:MAG: family 10 glycosylhydrolase [Flavobacteriaceae bacterium]|nr:family 10 glycosylhydrolase [Flavobacteriaceae bacterium]
MRQAIGLLLILSLASCGIFKTTSPAPKREFRGVWIATVANIDWPKDPNASWEIQKQDFNRILDFYKDLHFNAVIVQVRTAGDAFYPTELAPWSRYLTGKEGKAPTVADPLEWMIATAHEKGLEFHAWLNPYRATMSLDTLALAEEHDLKKNPGWMLPYGTKYYYNPGLPEVQDKLTAIMEELVLNYPVDAIHFDDYFYPYKISGENLNDSLAFQTYSKTGQTLDDWRRSNVDSLVRKVHQAIKKHKPWVQFGISPFGVWKNKDTDPRGSDTQAGHTTYEDLYADPLLWMEEGWIDYLIPQVYWSMDYQVASHRKIVDWWSANKSTSNLYVGNGTYKVKNNPDLAWNQNDELLKQVNYARNSKAVQGNAYFSAKSLMNAEKELVRIFEKKIYPLPALTPVTPLAPPFPAATPDLIEFSDSGDSLDFSITPLEASNWTYALIYKPVRKKANQPPAPKELLAKVRINSENQFSLPIDRIKRRKKIQITFLDRYGKESQPIFLHLEQSRQYDSKR